MPSIAKCLDRFTKRINKFDRQDLIDRAAILRERGYTEQEAQETVVREKIMELENERQQVAREADRQRVEIDAINNQAWKKARLADHEVVVRVDPRRVMDHYLKQGDDYSQQIANEVKGMREKFTGRTAKVDRILRAGNKIDPARLSMEVSADRIDFTDGRHRMLWAAMNGIDSVPVITTTESLKNFKPFIIDQVEGDQAATKQKTADIEQLQKDVLEGRDVFDVIKQVEPTDGTMIPVKDIKAAIREINPGVDNRTIDEWIVKRAEKQKDIDLVKVDPGEYEFNLDEIIDTIEEKYRAVKIAQTGDQTAQDLMTELTKADAAGQIAQYLENYPQENSLEVAYEMGRVGLQNPTYKDWLQLQERELTDQLSDARQDNNYEEAAYLEPLQRLYEEANNFINSYQTGASTPAYAVAQAYKNNEIAIGDRHLRRAVMGEKYSRRAYSPKQAGITIEQVRKMFPGQQVTINEDGEIAVKARIGRGVVIRNVDVIDVDRVAFNAAYGRLDSKNALIAGRYSEGVIEIRRDQAGDWVLAHESYHWMEDAGIISTQDAEILSREIQRLHAAGRWQAANPDDIGNGEDRANFVAMNLGRRAQAVGPVRRILDHIADWVDRFMNLFTRTSKGIVRDIETGQIYGRIDQPVKRQPLPQYMAKTDEDQQFEDLHDNSKEAKRFNKEWPAAINWAWKFVGDIWRNRKLGWKDVKPDTSFWDRLLSLPTHYFQKVPALKKLLDAGLGRHDEYYHLINHIENMPGGDSFLKRFALFKRRNKTQYKQIQNYLLDVDDNQNGYKIKKGMVGKKSYWFVLDRDSKRTGFQYEKEADAVKAMIGLEGKDLVENRGFTPEMAQMVGFFRTVTNNGFSILAENIRNIRRRYMAAKRQMPKVAYFDNTEKVMVDLNTALALMGDLRGSYFPRIRMPGQYTLHATKKGTNPILLHFDSKAMMNRKFNELQRQGYTVDRKRVTKLPEDVFQMGGSVIVLQAHINKALDRAQREYRKAVAKKLSKKKIDNIIAKQLEKAMPVVEQEFAKAIAEQVANNIKARGVRVHMIGRNQARGKDVWKGYEEDPVTALGLYVRGLAAGEAKRRMSFKMLRAFTGMDVPWDKFKADQAAEGKEVSYKDYIDFVNQRRIDPINQPNAFKDGSLYMSDMLRNDEAVDRFLGMVKGFATLKYLAGRIAAPFVNLTALPTSAVAAMSGMANIPINKAFRYLGRGAIGYRQYTFGKQDMPEWDRKVYDYIIDKGWHEAQYNKEALSVLRSKVGQFWDSLIDKSMYLFGLSERINRSGTIAGTFFGIRDQNQKQWEAASEDQKQVLLEQWAQQAKDISDAAHGVYGKANRPHYARGPHLGARLAQSFYVFKTFSHNYILTMLRLGIKQPKAAAWMMISPAILAGAGASVAMPILSLLARAVGIGGEDPEEELYKVIEENMGHGAATLAREGLFGATLGISTKGSLAIGITDLPTTIPDLLGAPYSMAEDLWRGAQQIRKGAVLKGVEKFLPNFMAAPIKGVREWTQGITTSTNAPIFFGTTPVRATWYEMLIRAASFNPARIATIRERQFKERNVEERFRRLSSDIYAKMKAYYLQPPEKRTPEDWMKILLEVEEYNRRVEKSGYVLPYITSRSIKANLRRAFKPSRKERLRGRD